MTSPYKRLPTEQFWKTAVAGQTPASVEGLYRKRFAISATDKIATAGSCFAQHIAVALKDRGFRVMTVEPTPAGLGKAERFGYGIYSARYGNIYTARHLLQLVCDAIKREEPTASDVWERDGRFFDALRPTVEPLGLSSVEEVLAHRADHLKHVRRMLTRMDVFVFTFGLTEAWRDRQRGVVYPMAPESLSGIGRYDKAKFEFVNFKAAEVFSDFSKFRDLVKEINPGARFIISVSPVPLTATASGRHVLMATVHSKSVLRTAAGQLYDTYDDIDYFPSFELIASPFLGCSFDSNMRSVSQAGVAAAMDMFFSEHGSARAKEPVKSVDDVVCEEKLLEAFA